VISTLKDLMATGDEILRIEGILSGTISFVFNQFSTVSSEKSNVRFSDVVKIAKERGYTVRFGRLQ
jgi:homoserine dehydrogenase